MEAKINGINIYEKPDYCPQCNMTKKEFRRRLGEAAYDNLVKTAELTPETVEQFKAMGFLSAPVVEVRRSEKSDNDGFTQTELPAEANSSDADKPSESVERWAGYRPELIKKAAAEAAITLASAEASPDSNN